MSDQVWFYELNQNQQGPVSGENLKSLIDSGSIPRETLVWREGMADWVGFEQTELCGSRQLPPSIPGNNPGPAGPLALSQPFVPRNARLKEDFNFGVFDVLGAGWKTMVADFWPFVGFYALAYIIYGVASNLLIPILIGTYPMLGGYMYYTLKRARNQPADVETVFDGFKRRLGSTIILSIFLVLPFIIGLIPLIIGISMVAANPENFENNPVPSIGLFGGGAALLILVSTIVTIICSLAALLCLDCDIGWSRAYSLASKAFSKHIFKFLGFAIITTILSFCGVLVFLVGSFVTGAWTIGAFSHIYEEAFGD